MDGNLYVWDLDRSDPTADPVLLRGHIGSALGVAFNHDGTRIASGGFDRTVRVWDPIPAAPPLPGEPRTGTEKITLRGHEETVWGVAFSPDGKKLVSASFDGTARVWDSEPVPPDAAPGCFTLGNHPPTPPMEDHRVNRLAFSRNKDGRRMATASWDGTVGVWDAVTGKAVATITHGGPVWGAAFGPDGERIVSGSWDATVKLWKIGSAVPERSWTMRSPVQSVAYSRTGKYVAAGCWDGTVKVWDAATGAEVATPAKHYLPVFSLAFGPGDRHLATASGDRTAKVWPITGGGKEAVLGGHGATVYTVAFDEAGKRIALASWDGSISMWDFTEGSGTAAKAWQIKRDPERPEKVGHADYVNGVAFSPDGRRLATVSNDKTLRFWDAANGNPVGEAKTLRGVVWDVAFHSDGNRVAVAVWNPKEWVKVVPVRP